MLLLVGKVGKPHGLGGEIKVVPETEDPSRVEPIQTLYLGQTVDSVVEFKVNRVRFQPYRSSTTILLELDEVDSIDDARALRGLNVYADQTDLPELEDGQWYLDDLAGMSVSSDVGEHIGIVEEVLDLPGHPVLVIARDSLPDALIPAIEPFVVSVDSSESMIVVKLIEGLID